MAVTIEKESYTRALLDEILPLGRKCWSESTVDKADSCAYYGERDFAIEPDIEQYERIASMGMMAILTLREERVLKGYIVAFTHQALHHKGILCAVIDTIFVEPDYRAYTAVLTERLEKELQALGVHMIGWPTHVRGPVHEILEARGYVADDIVMEKRLCVSQQQ